MNSPNLSKAESQSAAASNRHPDCSQAKGVEKPKETFVCFIDGFETTSELGFRKHTRNQHISKYFGLRAHKCLICHERFAMKYDRNMHMKLVHEEKEVTRLLAKEFARLVHYAIHPRKH